MTIIGAHVLEPALAVAWADSEVFSGAENRSAGMQPKLVINPAGFAFVMTGWTQVAVRAASCVIEAPDFGAALSRLPTVLRRAGEQTATSSREPGAFGSHHAALIGFDRAARAMTAYRFAACECFVPMLDYDQMVPRPPSPAGVVLPIGSNEVRLLAERQMDRLRDWIPHARGGALHVAVIRPGSITVDRLCDLSETAPPATPEPTKEPAHVC